MDSVFIGGKSVATSGTDHAAVSETDMIIPDGSSEAVPYVNVARSKDVLTTAMKTFIHGAKVWTEGSIIPASTEAPEAPPGVGEASGTWRKEGRAIATCHTVRVEGQKVIRLGDPTVQNHENCTGEVMTGAEADAILAERNARAKNVAAGGAPRRPKAPQPPQPPQEIQYLYTLEPIVVTANVSTANVSQPNVGHVAPSSQTNKYITIHITPATGNTSRNAPLAQYQVLQNETVVGYFFDTGGHSYKHRAVPAQGLHTYTANAPSPIRQKVSADLFANIKNVYLWAENIDASFIGPAGHADRLAVGRITLPVSDSGVVTLPNGDEDRVFEAQILQSSTQYIRSEMATNSRGPIAEDFAIRNSQTRIQYFMDLWEWYNLTQEKRPWDYKVHVSRVWGDIIRIGNFGTGIDSGALSNFHFGYVSAAAGFTLWELEYGSHGGQIISSLSPNPDEDWFATVQGYEAFVKHNGSERTQTIRWAPNPDSEPIEWTEVVPIKSDISFSEAVNFCISYQNRYNKI